MTSGIVAGASSLGQGQRAGRYPETVYRRSLPLASRDLLIQRSSPGNLAGVIGASAMVVDQLFARESIGRWLPVGSPPGVPEVALARVG